jgi:hypothetical protein
MALTAYFFPGQNPIGSRSTWVYTFFFREFGALGDVVLYATIGTIFLTITLCLYFKSSRSRTETT